MEFVNQLKQEKGRLKKEAESINERINAINILLESYGITTDMKTKIPVDYPKSEPLLKQIAYIIRSQERFMHNSEITKMLLKYNGDLKADEVPHRVSQVLSRAKRDDDGTGTLTSIQANNNRKNTFWGSKEWIENENTPKQENMYDKSIVSVKSTENVVKI